MGESYLQYVLWGLGSGIGVFTIFKWGDWQQIDRYPFIFIGWTLFFVSLIISAIFTQSIPLSISQLAFYGFEIVIFFTILTMPKKIKASYLLITLLLTTWTITLISIFFQFFPKFAKLLPGMNILYATYGHNHLAAILLLALPISWWFAINKKNGFENIIPNFIFQFIPVIFSIALLLSFGRTAVLIGFIELIIIKLVLNKQKTSIPKKLKKTQQFIEILFILVLLAKVFLSAADLLKPDFSCPVPYFKKQLCKSVSTEPRPLYWSQAIEIIKEFPLTGSGPKTFGITSTRYQQNPDIDTSYAHNAFLETYSDLGIVGGTIFLVLMLGMLIKITKKVEKKISWQFLVWLSIASIYTDVLFDFDWSFSGVFAFTLVLIAIVLREKKVVPTPPKKSIINSLQQKIKKIYKPKLLKSSILIIASIPIVISFIYLGVELKIYQKNIQQAFEFFPYFHWHKKIYETSLPESNYDRFLEIYKNHPESYPFFIKKEKNPVKKAYLRQQLFILEPWKIIDNSNIDYYLSQEKWDLAQQEIEKLYKLKKISLEKGFGWIFSYEDSQKLASDSLKVADGVLLEKPIVAADLYKQAQEIDEWAWDKHEAKILSLKVDNDPEKQLEFMRNFPNEKNEFWGKYKDIYSIKYLKIITYFLENGSLEKYFLNKPASNNSNTQQTSNKIATDIKNILSATDWLTWETWEIISETYGKEINKNSNFIEKQQRLVQDWYEIWKICSNTENKQQNNEKYQLNYKYSLNLSKNLINIGNNIIPSTHSEENIINKNYKKADEIIPFILETEKLWFDYPEIEKNVLNNKKTSYLKNYQQFFEESNYKYSFRYDDHWILWKSLFEEYLSEQNQDLDSAEKMIDIWQPIENWSYEDRLVLVKEIQETINKSLKNIIYSKENQDNNWEKEIENRAIKRIKIMNKLAPKNYWIASQPGNLYIYLNRLEEAKESFQACLDTYKYQEKKSHSECKTELESIEKKYKLNTNKFFETGEKIFNY
jgi:O-antigen ligase